MADLTRSAYAAAEAPLPPSRWLGALRAVRPRGGLLAVPLLAAAVLYILVPMVAVVLYGVATRWTANVAARRLYAGQTLDRTPSRTSGSAPCVMPQPRPGGRHRRSSTSCSSRRPAYWQRVRNPRIRPVHRDCWPRSPSRCPFVVIAFGLLSAERHGTRRPCRAPSGSWFRPMRPIAFSFVYWSIDALHGGRQRGGPVGSGPHLRSQSRGHDLARSSCLISGPAWPAAPSWPSGSASTRSRMVQILAGNRFETVPLYTLNLLKSTDADFNVLAVMTSGELRHHAVAVRRRGLFQSQRRRCEARRGGHRRRRYTRGSPCHEHHLASITSPSGSATSWRSTT